jgi:hypothetical protein
MVLSGIPLLMRYRGLLILERLSEIKYILAETYPVYRTIYDQMIKSFEVIPQNSSAATSVSTYDNRNYGIQIQYPSDWSVQESKSSVELINVVAFLSPTGNPFPTAEVTIYMDRLHNSTTNLDNYAHFVAFTDYESRTSYFHAFKLLELSTNSSTIAGSLSGHRPCVCSYLHDCYGSCK